jgi:hypothetical protein
MQSPTDASTFGAVIREQNCLSKHPLGFVEVELAASAWGKSGVARTAAFAVRVFSGHHRHRAVFYRPSADGSKLRRAFLSDFFIAVLLLKRREKLTEPDFALLARAFNGARALHPFYLTAWVLLPDPSADGHCICAPVHPTTISLAMK